METQLRWCLEQALELYDKGECLHWATKARKLLESPAELSPLDLREKLIQLEDARKAGGNTRVSYADIQRHEMNIHKILKMQADLQKAIDNEMASLTWLTQEAAL